MRYQLNASLVDEACRRYQPVVGFRPSYGTAGFRAEASLLPPTLFRCGLLAALKSLQTQQLCGLMVTASHNPEPDNGAKLMGPDGEMLDPDWEAHADRLACASSVDEISAQVEQVIRQSGIAVVVDDQSRTLGVLIGHDTRPSAASLVSAAAAGVVAMGIPVIHAGLQSTPQLHFRVRACNLGLPWSDTDYFDLLAGGFSKLLEPVADLTPSDASGSVDDRRDSLVVDCANGVGAAKLRELVARLSDLGCRDANIDIRNTGKGGLNHRVGSDFVEKERVLPLGFEDVPDGTRCCSVDGDADRLVYFTRSGDTLILLDGNKIAALAADFIQDTLQNIPEIASETKIGVVQTAYANGASTKFLKTKLGIETVFTPTGVKHLHHEAIRFDVGIYFEANGHGTILFSDVLVSKLKKVQSEHTSARDLLAMTDIINQAVGDALSGILMVESILRRRQWELTDWNAMYTDLPSRQLKVAVADRTVIKTADAETRCVCPGGLQELISAAVDKYVSGRSFVRPSGTEDVVRIYAEAASQAEADALTKEVARLVHKYADGVGPLP